MGKKIELTSTEYEVIRELAAEREAEAARQREAEEITRRAESSKARAAREGEQLLRQMAREDETRARAAEEERQRLEQESDKRKRERVRAAGAALNAPETARLEPVVMNCHLPTEHNICGNFLATDGQFRGDGLCGQCKHGFQSPNLSAYHEELRCQYGAY